MYFIFMMATSLQPLQHAALFQVRAGVQNFSRHGQIDMGFLHTRGRRSEKVLEDWNLRQERDADGLLDLLLLVPRGEDFLLIEIDRAVALKLSGFDELGTVIVALDHIRGLHIISEEERAGDAVVLAGPISSPLCRQAIGLMIFM